MRCDIILQIYSYISPTYDRTAKSVSSIFSFRTNSKVSWPNTNLESICWLYCPRPRRPLSRSLALPCCLVCQTACALPSSIVTSKQHKIKCCVTETHRNERATDDRPETAVVGRCVSVYLKVPGPQSENISFSSRSQDQTAGQATTV